MPHHRAKHPRPGLLILRCLRCGSEPETLAEPFDIFTPGELPCCLNCQTKLTIMTRVLDNTPKVNIYRHRKKPPRVIQRSSSFWNPL